MNIHTIAEYLNDSDNKHTGFHFDCYPVEGDVDVLQVNLIGREEIPVFISVTDNQILGISYLWGEEEVRQECRTNMMETMLELNIPMPLSSFAKIDDKYVVYGALALQSSLQDIEHEISALSDNCLEVIDELAEYLK